MIETNVTYVPGDDEGHVYVCITSPTRMFSRHVWIRAMVHIGAMKDESWAVRENAINCIVKFMRQMPADDPTKMDKPPQFSWKGIPGKL